MMSYLDILCSRKHYDYISRGESEMVLVYISKEALRPFSLSPLDLYRNEVSVQIFEWDKINND